MSLNTEIEACKAFYMKREREIMDNCSRMVAEAGKSKLEYDKKLEELNLLFTHME
jgi:hypothetical protein